MECNQINNSQSVENSTQTGQEPPTGVDDASKKAPRNEAENLSGSGAVQRWSENDEKRPMVSASENVKSDSRMGDKNNWHLLRRGNKDPNGGCNRSAVDRNQSVGAQQKMIRKPDAQHQVGCALRFVRSFLEAVVASGPEHTEEEKQKGLLKRERKRTINRQVAQRKRKREKADQKDLNHQATRLMKANQNLKLEHERLAVLLSAAQRLVDHMEIPGNHPNHATNRMQQQLLQESSQMPPVVVDATAFLGIGQQWRNSNQLEPPQRVAATSDAMNLMVQSFLQPTTTQHIDYALPLSVLEDLNDSLQNFLNSQRQKRLLQQLVDTVAQRDLLNRAQQLMGPPIDPLRTFLASNAVERGGGFFGTVPIWKEILSSTQPQQQQQPPRLTDGLPFQRSAVPAIDGELIRAFMSHQQQQDPHRRESHSGSLQQPQQILVAALLHDRQAQHGIVGGDQDLRQMTSFVHQQQQQQSRAQPQAAPDPSDLVRRFLLAQIHQQLSRR